MLINFNVEPFEESKFKKILYPNYNDIYSEFRICILNIFYKKFSNKYNLETKIVRDDFINLINQTPFLNEFDFMAKKLMFLALQNTNWDIQYLSFDDYNQKEGIEDYVKRKNRNLNKIVPYIKEQIHEATCYFQNVLYCIGNHKIARYLKEKKEGMLHPYDDVIMDLIKNLHPLYYQNSPFYKVIDDIYYIVFSIGLVWDYPITFYQIHPNFYAMAYALDLMLDDIFNERKKYENKK